MKKFFLLSLIFTAILESAGAQDLDTLKAKMQTITIRQNRLEIPFSRSARNIDVFEKKEIHRSPVQSLAGMLSYTPGVDVRQRGPVGVQADLSIRGGTFDQALVLLDGIKMTDPQTGHHALNVPVNLESVQQIQVLKGPGARIYGQNAFTGAVNIITKIPGQRRIAVDGYGGDFDSYGGTASMALPGKSYSQYLSLSRDYSGGYRYNTDYGINNVFYQSNLKTGAGKFKLMGGYTDRTFGANGFYASPQYKDQWESIQTSIASAGYEYRNAAVTLKPRIYWRRNHDKYRLRRDDPSFYQNIHTTNVVGGEVNTSVRTSLGETGVGLEYRNEQIDSNNLGNHQRDNAGLYAEHHLRLFDRLDVTPGLYLNWYSDYDWNLFPGIDVAYMISPSFRVYANVGKSYRVPTYTDLYYTGPTNIGNPHLKPEEAVTWEGGLRYIGNGLLATASYYHRNADNLIDWVRASANDPWQPQNFYNVLTDGVELSVEMVPAQWLGDNFIINHVKASYTHTNSDLKNGVSTNSRYALEYVKDQLVIGINHKLYRNLTNDLKIRYMNRVALDSYWVMDSRVTWQQHKLSVFVEATNLTDRHYTETNLVPMPGRWIRTGFRYRFDY